jgi:prephenate dehydrogenase
MKTISIIGLGLIGGSIAKALKNSDNSLHISAYDFPEIIDKALSQSVIDKKLTKIEEAADSNIIFLCLPIDLSLETFEKIIPLAGYKTIITDVCSVKGIFADKWLQQIGNKSKGFYIGGHPMTGKEIGGYENSDPLLFENSVYILSDKAKDYDHLNDFLEIINLLGARVKFLDPYLHDQIVAAVSHLPQLVSIALVNAISEGKDETNFLDFAAGGFKDMTRIASSDSSIWEPIIKNNKAQILQALAKFNLTLIETIDLIARDDLSSISKLFESARLKRSEIPKNTKGFLNPLYDIFIYVKDEPGVLYNLTKALHENSINIKDLELLKVREGTGGTFRVSFENETAGIKAKQVLIQAGFRVD